MRRGGKHWLGEEERAAHGGFGGHLPSSSALPSPCKAQTAASRGQVAGMRNTKPDSVRYQSLISQNHGAVWAGRHLRASLVPIPREHRVGRGRAIPELWKTYDPQGRPQHHREGNHPVSTELL